MATHRFTSPGQLANQLRKLAAGQVPKTINGLLEIVGQEAKHDARERIVGRITPLGQTGPFPTWQPLADSTIEQKERLGLGKGGDARSMLFATGDMHDSIEYTVERSARRVAVGSDVTYAQFLEYGTSRMPPRPFLGPAMIRTVDKLYFNRTFENAITRTLANERPF